MTDISEDRLKNALWLVYLSAALTAAGKGPDDVAYTQHCRERFEEYYGINKKNLHLRLHLNIKDADIYVHPVTPHLRKQEEAVTGQEFMFQDYNGWEGKVMGISKNGIYDAYKVRISGDGVYFVTITINMEDIRPLEDKKFNYAVKQE